jgi:hypothetical protein
VLIGVTGLGLLEYQNTPIGERMPAARSTRSSSRISTTIRCCAPPALAPGIEVIVFVLWAER